MKSGEPCATTTDSRTELIMQVLLVEVSTTGSRGELMGCVRKRARGKGNSRQTDCEHHAESKLPAARYMQAQDRWYGKQENPNIGDEVCDVSEVTESDQVEASSRHFSRVPEALNGPALKSQDDGNCQDP